MNDNIKIFLINTTKNIFFIFGTIYLVSCLTIVFNLTKINIPFPEVVFSILFGFIYFLRSITDTKSNDIEDNEPHTFNFKKFLKVIFLTHILSTLVMYFYPIVNFNNLVINNFKLEYFNNSMNLLLNIITFQNENPLLYYSLKILSIVFLTFVFIKNSVFYFFEFIFHGFLNQFHLF
jgi:hypothetical protein